MGMTSQQDLPLQKVEQSEWSMRKLFPFASASKAFAKTFINVFDVLLGLAILLIGLSELFNRDVSWFFYTITLLLLVCAFIERRATSLDSKSKEVT